MRRLITTFVMAAMLMGTSQARAQQDSPFGADPFAPGASGAKAKSATARDAVIKRAKHELAKGRKPVELVAAGRKASEQKIRSTLGDETSLTFIETPLEEAVQVLSQMHNIPILIDNRALEEIGLSSDVPVSLDLHKVTLRSGLRILLRNLDLTYIIKDEVLQITTMEAAEQNLSVEMYQLPDNLAQKSDDVVRVLTGSVAPDTWEALGGPSTVYPLDHLIIVSTTSDHHQRVQDFLSMLIERYGK